MTDINTLTPPAAEQDPQAGGSYIRQPDGTLVPAVLPPTPAPAPATDPQE